MPVLLAHVLPSPKWIFSRSSGTSADNSAANASPRASRARRVSAPTSSSHASPSEAMPPPSISFA